MGSLALLLAVAGATCNCPTISASPGDAPLLVLADSRGNPTVIVCGATVEERQESSVTLAEFEVFHCGESEPILSFGALEPCEIEPRERELRITVLSRWPFGPDWAWVDVPIREHTVPADADRPLTERFVLEPPHLDPEQIESTLHDCSIRQDPGSLEEIETCIGRILAVALAGDVRGRRRLASLSYDLADTGHPAEVHAEAVRLYQAYARETGRVKVLDAPDHPPAR